MSREMTKALDSLYEQKEKLQSEIQKIEKQIGDVLKEEQDNVIGSFVGKWMCNSKRVVYVDSYFETHKIYYLHYVVGVKKIQEKILLNVITIEVDSYNTPKRFSMEWSLKKPFDLSNTTEATSEQFELISGFFKARGEELRNVLPDLCKVFEV